MKILGAKAAVDKEWNMENLPVWQASTVRTKQEVIEETEKRAKLFGLLHLWTCVISNFRIGQDIPEVRKYSLNRVPLHREATYQNAREKQATLCQHTLR